ncbi:Exopolysaccharide biosynthesis protein [Klebsiella pneumoniae]|uniref:Exopolysaccharide biosynthesis protein n=1 Tax=Klebsiella pneumoniae TaxID=573 RepID=A0A2X3EAU1_KLEPN|nr:Exopolysaccharide biosynthesis protein [Klebsiella pneumoniae]
MHLRRMTFLNEMLLPIFLTEMASVYSSETDILIFGGGGNLIEGLYSEGHDFIQNNIGKFHKVIIMPSTIRGYSDLFINNIDKFVVFCRENITFDYIKSLNYEPNKNVFITDDMAFYLDLNKYLSLKPSIKNRPTASERTPNL